MVLIDGTQLGGSPLETLPWWELVLAVIWGCRPECLHVMTSCGLEFRIGWQSQETNTSYLTASGTRSECFKKPKKKPKGFWWLVPEVPKSQFHLILLVDTGWVRQRAQPRFKGREIRLHFLIGEAKNLQPSSIYYSDHIKREPLKENKLTVMFRKHQRIERPQHESGFWKMLVEKRKHRDELPETYREPKRVGPCRNTRESI